jgi:acyl-coenzyme A synthetase/AMP-(fatty) acid ligase
VGRLVEPRAILLGPQGGAGLNIHDALGAVPRLTVTPDGLKSDAGDTSPSGVEAANAAFDAAADDPAFIVFTSGTTGRPKGIVHAHRWLNALGDSNRRRIPPQSDDVALATGEWSFVSALGHNVLFPLRNGIAAAVLEERATPDRILSVVERDRVTLLYSVATLYRRILGHAGLETRYDVTSLRGVNSTGEPLEAAVRAEWQRRFGCPLWEHYGISEAQMVLGHGPSTEERLGSVGKPWGVTPRIVNDALEPLPAGTDGRLAFDADYAGFFLEYLGDPEQTAATFAKGLFLTNDVARCDADGYLWIIGRADDCFKSKGVLIVPREIEDALLELGLFEETCVFAIPDTEIGHRIGVAVVTRDGVSPAEASRSTIAAKLAGRIAPFKVPQEVTILPNLPKNANGKTQRRAVAQSFMAHTR